MTGRDYINCAKDSFYPTETYVSDTTLATFLNYARRKVIKHGKIGFTEISLSLVAQTPSYTLTKDLLELYSVLLEWDNTIRYLLTPIPWGRFPLSTSTFFAPPWNYSFIPTKTVGFYPCPDRAYSAYLYGVPFPSKTYTSTTLDDTDTDITTDNYLEPVAVLVASRLASNDQNYELSEFLESKLFFDIMRISKI
uniref:Uncharacterized protein n=1 Tax=Caldisericum exile TaxID=693075 RepID=A0A7C4YF70_9BACT